MGNKSTIRSIIVDDEPKNVHILKELIEHFCDGVEVEGNASSVDEAVMLINQSKPDLVFLDIEMPGKNAFDLLNELKPFEFEVVFVTAFDEYAMKAFKYSAIDYILKPVNIDDLRDTIEKVKSRLTEKNITKRFENLLKYKPEGENKIAIQTKAGYSFFAPGEIVCCTAKGPYTWLYTADGKKILSFGTLKVFEDLLPENMFCRIHHAHLINIEHISSYTKGRVGIINLSNGLSLEVSRRKKDKFLARFNK